MKLYFRQRLFSWFDSYDVYDESGATAFTVQGKLAWGKLLQIYDRFDQHVGTLRQVLFTWLPRFEIETYGRVIGEITKEFSFFKQEYTVDGPGWSVLGDFFDHEYEISRNGAPVAEVSKKWFTFGDAYEIFINEDSGADEVTVLATVLVIDACIEAQNN